MQIGFTKINLLSRNGNFEKKSCFSIQYFCIKMRRIISCVEIIVFRKTATEILFSRHTCDQQTDVTIGGKDEDDVRKWSFLCCLMTYCVNKCIHVQF